MNDAQPSTQEAQAGATDGAGVTASGAAETVSRPRQLWRGAKYVVAVTVAATGGLFRDKCMRNAASLSFYALFSIAPIIYLAVYVAGILASDVNFQQQITEQFSELLGEQAAQGVTVLLSTLEMEQQNRFQLAVGLGVLAFSATNIFVQIQNTFNEVFRVQPMPKVGIIKQLLDRAISLGIILSLGFLLIISLVLDSVVLVFHEFLFELLNAVAVVLVQVLQMLILVFLITGVIYGMFHFLPDVYLPRHLKLRGSLLVATMLLLGKYGIGLYIANSKLSELGGASASIFVLMLWIYYTSIILFFGAEMIRAMSEREQLYLEPRRYATRIRTVIEGEAGPVGDGDAASAKTASTPYPDEGGVAGSPASTVAAPVTATDTSEETQAAGAASRQGPRSPA